MRGWLGIAAVLAAGTLFARSAAEEARLGGRATWDLNIGPFFEYRTAETEGLPPSVAGLKTFWAVRPFYSQVRDEATGVVERDVLWPLGTCHATRSGYWWDAAVLLYGDAREDRPSWSFDLFPIWFSGRDAAGEGYWAFFPLYGTHPHFLLADDITFLLWPLYHDYAVKGVRSHAVLWPLFSWKDDPRGAFGFWPIAGTARRRESDHSYVLWPIVTWAKYFPDRDTSSDGWSFMFWPLYGQVSRSREDQYLFLPPFFSYAQTDATRRWRLPWPLVDVELSPVRSRTSVFPLYEHVTGYSYHDRRVEETTHRVGWKIFEWTELTTSVSREKVISFFPFFAWERRWTQAKGASAPRLSSRYLRVWPFYSSSTEDGHTLQRALELIPIRHAEGFDRNWSPFWTLWEREDLPDGSTRNSLLWKFINWHGAADPRAH